eukprot:TRINITY_DN169_c0_g1_i1.p1 TRINITY_DN169_c0_g1~~TRINITY_DN169_c0_g1_i1.p1  ORF type:complete len:211 (+),score=34.93 TRINITY_DN169_c0_g1_i1:225-857(+)
MASTVHYKFKSAKDFDAVAFSGMVISLFDLKRAIVEQKNLHKGMDFDLAIVNDQTKEGASEFPFDVMSTLRFREALLPGRQTPDVFLPSVAPLLLLTEYTDDTQAIPKNTSVVVKRVPAKSKGGGLLAKIKQAARASATYDPFLSLFAHVYYYISSRSGSSSRISWIHPTLTTEDLFPRVGCPWCCVTARVQRAFFFFSRLHLPRVIWKL